MAYWICSGCGVRNREQDDRCEECGIRAAPRGQRAAEDEEVERRTCACGGSLDARGFCGRGNGFPMVVRCPFVCPRCRYPLHWDGGCESCRGTSTARREDWAFPGDRYELEAGHYVKVAGGPRSACSSVENLLGLADCVAALGDAPLVQPLAPLPSGGANDAWFERFAPWSQEAKPPERAPTIDRRRR